MDLPLFYAPDYRETSLLPLDESKHAIRVLRLHVGSEILVSDGLGSLSRCILLDESLRGCSLKIEEEIPDTRTPIPPLLLAVAPTKNIDRIEWLLEKLVEVGLQEFILLYTTRTVRNHVNLDRLHKVMIAAMKQSRKRTLTKISEVHGLEALLTHYKIGEKLAGYIGYCEDSYPRKALVKIFHKQVPSLFIIGPEGDFTPEEVALVVSKGVTPVTLGEERLRTETAGLYAGISHSLLNAI